jgi:hypothetical protein
LLKKKEGGFEKNKFWAALINVFLDIRIVWLKLIQKLICGDREEDTIWKIILNSD